MGILFNVIAAAYRLFTHRYAAEWEEPFIDEPCIFLCNHAGAFGPVEISAKFPLRKNIRLWCNEGIMNRKECPAYVRQDYWWKPESRLAPLYSATIPYAAAAIVPPVLKSAPTIPVFHDIRVMTTMHKSVDAMKQGMHIVIFPEQPSGFQSHHDWLNTGWMPLCTMWQHKSGKDVRLYPVHIDYKKHVFHVGRPVQYDGSRSLEEQKEELIEGVKPVLRGEFGPLPN